MMNRVLVVPWSMDPTKTSSFAIFLLRFSVYLRENWALFAQLLGDLYLSKIKFSFFLFFLSWECKAGLSFSLTLTRIHPRQHPAVLVHPMDGSDQANVGARFKGHIRLSGEDVVIGFQTSWFAANPQPKSCNHRRRKSFPPVDFPKSRYNFHQSLMNIK